MNGKRILVFLTLGLVVAIGLVFLISTWADQRFLADFYPPDRSYVGPTLVAAVIQWAGVGIVFAAVYPPVRHWIERELDHVHKKLDHVIEHHPDIPSFPKGRPKKENP